MICKVENDLIFDLGFHKGYDAEFYLRKGFRVVGVEAVPELAEDGRGRLAGYGDRLEIINKALYCEPDVQVKFYKVPKKDDWGSLYKGVAEKGVESSVEIKVRTITLSQLFDTYGVPRYIKCDMEGGDLIFRDQLMRESRRPIFVSVELNDGFEGEVLESCGYEVGQIVNQWLNPFVAPPNPAREGVYASTKFSSEMSGLFGLELSRERWVSIDKVDALYRRWKELRDQDQQLAVGWLDLHVARKKDIEGPRIT